MAVPARGETVEHKEHELREAFIHKEVFQSSQACLGWGCQTLWRAICWIFLNSFKVNVCLCLCTSFEIPSTSNKYCCRCVLELSGRKLQKHQGSPVSLAAADRFLFTRFLWFCRSCYSARKEDTWVKRLLPHERLMLTEATGSSELVLHFNLSGKITKIKSGDLREIRKFLFVQRFWKMSSGSSGEGAGVGRIRDNDDSVMTTSPWKIHKTHKPQPETGC